MRRLLQTLVLIAVLGAVLATVSLVGLYRAARQMPDFYEVALRSEPSRQQEAGYELEQQVLQLHNGIRHEGYWEAKFTDEQINGWLAVDLPRKFARLLPPEAQEPRVALEANRARIACRYEGRAMTTVFSLLLEFHLTDEPNVVAVRVLKARAGALPLPLKQFLDEISQAAHQADLTLRWAQTDGDPVALVTVPSEHEEYHHHRVHLERLELRPGQLLLAGRTENASEPRRPLGIQQAALQYRLALQTIR